MPSREDIVKALRGAAEARKELLLIAKTGVIPPDFYAECTRNANRCEQLAAEVEAMRCVECKKSKGPSVNAVTFCNKFFVNVPHDHGCFDHEQKPAG